VAHGDGEPGLRLRGGAVRLFHGGKRRDPADAYEIAERRRRRLHPDDDDDDTCHHRRLL
jgi:hypothetical protein